MLHYETVHFNLLLVESDKEVKQKLIAYINNSKLNVSISVAETGTEAMSKLSIKRYSCVLMDYDLSDMNAQMLLSCIQDGPTLAIPVIIFSKEEHSEKLALEIIETGAIDFIPIKKCNSFVLERLILYALVREQYIDSQRNYLEDLHQLKEEQRFSEEKIKNKILQLTKDQAEQKCLAKSEFLANMSHELRTPLNAILGFTQLIALTDGEHGPHSENIFEIEKAGNHLLELINGLLDLEKIEANKTNLVTETIDIDEAIEESLSLLKPVARSSDVSLSFANSSGVQVRGDKLKIKQILLNILSNAIKYNVPEGSVIVKVGVKAESALLSILDSGQGIAKEKLGEVFHPFKRINMENSDIEGSGIGLTITKKLVEQMNGKIEVESEEHQGSKFTVTLPLVNKVFA